MTTTPASPATASDQPRPPESHASGRAGANPGGASGGGGDGVVVLAAALSVELDPVARRLGLERRKGTWLATTVNPATWVAPARRRGWLGRGRVPGPGNAVVDRSFRVTPVLLGPGSQAGERLGAVLNRVAEGPDGPVQRVVLVGFSGGLFTGLAQGDLVMPAWVLRPDGQACLLDGGPPRWIDRRVFPLNPADLGDRARNLLTLDEPLLSPADKLAAGDRFGAGLVDMETWSVATVCSERHVPLTVLRVISDGVFDPLPAWAMRLVSVDGRPDVRAALTTLAAGPWRLPAMLRMAQAAKVGGAALADDLLNLLAWLARPTTGTTHA